MNYALCNFTLCTLCTTPIANEDEYIISCNPHNAKMCCNLHFACIPDCIATVSNFSYILSHTNKKNMLLLIILKCKQKFLMLSIKTFPYAPQISNSACQAY